ncbi:MAG: DUF1800 family protein, partial [Pseudomonadota bacterium]
GSGSGGGSGGAVSSDPASKIDTEVQASRFLSRSTFGGSKSDIADLIGSDAAAWVASEFAKPATLTLPTLSQYPLDNLGRPPRDTVDTLYWDHIISSDDQLRQRMAFALSQIIVYSDAGRINQLMRAYWQDILIRNAFGNFRDLLEEVTYSPAMGTWLTYASNRKSDERTGRMPDENYAREIMQLFSIGLVELNMDGTPKLDGSGRQIETYSNEDIEGLARVFTGLGYASGSFFAPSDGDLTQQMVMYPEYHSEAEKTFLGTTIPAGTSGEESIDLAIDTIFNHPNVAPFISRLLIQRFTQSDPAPQYVENVATAFETGRFVAEGGQEFGTGVRGDLEATLAAILLDPTMFEEPDAGATITSGKVREPILRFTHWARAFNVSGLDASNEQRLGDTKRTDVALGQQAFSSPSVFNFYRPGYVAPGTITGDQGMTIPEFQLVNESSIIGYMNFMTDFAFDIPSEYDRDNRTYTPDYSEELALVDDPEALVEHLDDLLTNGQMADAEKADIIDIISTIDIRESDPERNAADREEVVQAAVALFLISPAYAVTW